MGFSELVKYEVKRQAAFQCCRCHSIGVEVHHIIPQEHGGSDDIENAAPLCPTCHAYFGGNPDKRKEITQMRDCWYLKVSLLPNQFGYIA
jgi:5-methylcytosine-specific restriction endonuclease McrA